VPARALQSLGQIRQSGGKYFEAFALEGDFNVDDVRSATGGKEVSENKQDVSYKYTGSN
jgi:predicted NUDIX family NTP pyrophosphohydrolase